MTAHGLQLPQSKVTPEIVREIRATKSRKKMAEKYGIHIRTVDKIKNYTTWYRV